jgi:hypothetical protein
MKNQSLDLIFHGYLWDGDLENRGAGCRACLNFRPCVPAKEQRAGSADCAASFQLAFKLATTPLGLMILSYRYPG